MLNYWALTFAKFSIIMDLFKRIKYKTIIFPPICLKPTIMLKTENEIVYRFLGSPFFWRNKARELKYASDKLLPSAMDFLSKLNEQINQSIDAGFDKIEPNVFSIFLALTGFSTECLFKAFIIRDNPSYISNGVLSNKLTNHDLIQLAQLGKIKLTSYEKIYCRQAMDAMVEFRYPIDKKMSQTTTVQDIGGKCYIVFNDLYDRLYPDVDHIIIPGSRSKKTRLIRLKKT